MKEKTKCPQCGYLLNNDNIIKCPRCGIIITKCSSCSGNCLKCSTANKSH